MEQEVNSISINGVEYVRKDSVQENLKAQSLDGFPYQIVRTYTAGVFAGYVKSRNGQEVVMTQARRLWYWKGAESLSEMAIHGIRNPNECKFACPVDVTLIQAVELLNVTDKAQKSIQGVKIWQA